MSGTVDADVRAAWTGSWRANKILRLLVDPNRWLICAHMVLRDRTGDKGKRVPRSPLNSHCVQMVIKQCNTSSSNSRFGRQRPALPPSPSSSLSVLVFIRCTPPVKTELKGISRLLIDYDGLALIVGDDVGHERKDDARRLREGVGCRAQCRGQGGRTGSTGHPCSALWLLCEGTRSILCWPELFLLIYFSYGKRSCTLTSLVLRCAASSAFDPKTVVPGVWQICSTQQPCTFSSNMRLQVDPLTENFNPGGLLLTRQSLPSRSGHLAPLSSVSG